MGVGACPCLQTSHKDAICWPLRFPLLCVLSTVTERPVLFMGLGHITVQADVALLVERHPMH